MSFAGELLVGLVIAVGLVGVLLPLVPGLLLVFAAVLTWAVIEGGTLAWLVFGVVTLVLAIGTAAKYVLPARDLAAAGTPRSTLVVGALAAVVGFFVIPVVGLLVGGLLGIYLAELSRLRGDHGQAARSTVITLRAVGIGILIELAAGVVGAGIWALGALAT